MSLNTFAIILQFDYERFHILSGWLPLLNAALSISVEVLFLLVKQGLSLYTGDVVLFKLLLCLCSLYITLLLQESNQLQLTLLLFFTFLLFSKLQLLVAYAPKFSELFFFLILVLLFFLRRSIYNALERSIACFISNLRRCCSSYKRFALSSASATCLFNTYS